MFGEVLFERFKRKKNVKIKRTNNSNLKMLSLLIF